MALVEDSLKRLNEIIVGKKTSINYKKTMSSIHIKSKVRAPTQPKLKALAEVLDDGQFRDYNLVFNPVDSSIEFVDPDTEKLEHRSTLFAQHRDSGDDGLERRQDAQNGVH